MMNASPYVHGPRVTPTLSGLIDAVLRHGSFQWYELSVRMGFSDFEIDVITSDKPAYASKLLAII
jgi:hypothetical protein